MSWLEKVKKYVKQYSNDCNDDHTLLLFQKKK